MSNQRTLITTHSVETPSGRISYASAGSGPAALFVHGVVLNKQLWRHQLAGLCLDAVRRDKGLLAAHDSALRNAEASFNVVLASCPSALIARIYGIGP